MSLATAAIAIHRRVSHTRQVRYQCLQGEAPGEPMAADALADWVAAELAAGRLTLLDAGLLEIDGQWSRYRFPCTLT